MASAPPAAIETPAAPPAAGSEPSFADAFAAAAADEGGADLPPEPAPAFQRYHQPAEQQDTGNPG
jgi:hypothetical protein